MSVWFIVIFVMAACALILSTILTVMYFLDYRASEVVNKASTDVQSLSTSAPLNASVVTTADVQTLTNKILTDSSNVIYAKALRNTDGIVSLTGGAPTANQVLMATSTTDAEWKELSIDPLDISDGTIGNLSSTTGTIGTLTSTTGTIGALTATSFTMPTGANNGYVLTSDGSGVGTWAAAAAGGTTYVEIDLTSSVTTNAYTYDSGTVFIVKQSAGPAAQYTARFDVTETGTTVTVGTTYRIISAITQNVHATRLLFLDENGVDHFYDICNNASSVTDNTSPWSPVSYVGDLIADVTITYIGGNVWVASGSYSG